MVCYHTRGTESGEAAPRSAHESFDVGPGNYIGMWTKSV